MDLIEKTLSLLKKGEIIVAPTDTVYGLFGDATSDIAVQRIYKIKNRPMCNPLIAHVSSINMAKMYTELSSENKELIDIFWGNSGSPITFVVPLRKNSSISSFVTAGLGTLAIRMPSHPVSLEIINKFGKPLAAPSANTSTFLSPTSADMVKKDLGNKVPLIIDAGKCVVGVESTILDITEKPYRILRHGGLPLEDIEKTIGQKILKKAQEDVIRSPGMMKKHYSPSIKVRMNASFPLEGEAFIAFGETDIKYDANLSESGSLAEAARNLFSALKFCDD
ncbi:MAG: threonylcarbamoyl-AMP synthase, partial [Holosporales bacterium]|nr:threonylcarbamoyl-AMP synthase [Holosporales bacterium]